MRAFEGNHTVENYDGWDEVHIESIGFLKVPKSWYHLEKDGVSYIYDSEDNPVMIECNNFSKWRSNEVCEKYRHVDTVSSQVFPNHAMQGKSQIETTDKMEELFFIYLPNDSIDQSVRLFVWDSTISEETVIKIAKSFEAEYLREDR